MVTDWFGCDTARTGCVVCNCKQVTELELATIAALCGNPMSKHKRVALTKSNWDRNWAILLTGDSNAWLDRLLILAILVALITRFGEYSRLCGHAMHQLRRMLLYLHCLLLQGWAGNRHHVRHTDYSRWRNHIWNALRRHRYRLAAVVAVIGIVGISTGHRTGNFHFRRQSHFELQFHLIKTEKFG